MQVGNIVAVTKVAVVASVYLRHWGCAGASAPAAYFVSTKFYFDYVGLGAGAYGARSLSIYQSIKPDRATKSA